MKNTTEIDIVGRELPPYPRSSNDVMGAREWFDTLDYYAREKIKAMTLESALEHIEGAIEELEDIASALRADIERQI